MKKLLTLATLRSITMFCLCAVIALPTVVYADASPREAGATLLEFKDDETKTRYYDLLEELRCLVCQNQSLADSDAGLAQDLRRQVYNMVEGGASNREITDYMVERYGDFVLYNPPLKATTILLWFGPFILAGIGIVALVLFLINRGEKKANILLDEARRKRAAALLAKAESDSNDKERNSQ
jgi:cytochrome c-type biogenesis protein CcmH